MEAGVFGEPAELVWTGVVGFAFSIELYALGHLAVWNGQPRSLFEVRSVDGFPDRPNHRVPQVVLPQLLLIRQQLLRLDPRLAEERAGVSRDRNRAIIGRERELRLHYGRRRQQQEERQQYSERRFHCTF